MPCITSAPDTHFEDHLERMLCYACQFLTPEQLQQCQGASGWIGLHQWYIEHLMHDWSDAQLGKLENVEHSFFGSKEERIEKYKKHCISELDRLGMKIESNSSGWVAITPKRDKTQ